MAAMPTPATVPRAKKERRSIRSDMSHHCGPDTPSSRGPGWSDPELTGKVRPGAHGCCTWGRERPVTGRVILECASRRCCKRGRVSPGRLVAGSARGSPHLRRASSRCDGSGPTGRARCRCPRRPCTQRRRGGNGRRGHRCSCVRQRGRHPHCRHGRCCRPGDTGVSGPCAAPARSGPGSGCGRTRMAHRSS